MTASPFGEARGTVGLHLKAGSPLAELFVVDHAFNLVDRAVGELDVQVEPGVYKLKAQLGEATVEQLVLVDRDQEVDLSQKLELASPAPLADSARSHDDHVNAAVNASHKVAPATRGGDTAISIVARRWDEQGRADQEHKEAWLSTVSLHRPDGGTVLSLGDREVHREAPDPWMADAETVEPGGYVLRWHDRSGLATEQAVHAVDGWETEVYLLDEHAGGPAGTGSVRTSVLMTRAGFDPSDDMLRRVEEARGALADERRVASQAVTEALFAKFDNPMLGLFGAHLMIVAREELRLRDEATESQRRGKPMPAPVDFDQSLFDTAVANLRDLLGPAHPDGVALATQVSDPDLDALEPVTVPPLLWGSWKWLIGATNDAPHLVPVETWLRTIRLVPARPFLAWAPPDDERGARHAWRQAASAGLTRGESESEDAFRRRLTSQLLAPRAAIDALLDGDDE